MSSGCVVQAPTGWALLTCGFLFEERWKERFKNANCEIGKWPKLQAVAAVPRRCRSHPAVAPGVFGDVPWLFKRPDPRPDPPPFSGMEGGGPILEGVVGTTSTQQSINSPTHSDDASAPHPTAAPPAASDPRAAHTRTDANVELMVVRQQRDDIILGGTFDGPTTTTPISHDAEPSDLLHTPRLGAGWGEDSCCHSVNLACCCCGPRTGSSSSRCCEWWDEHGIMGVLVLLCVSYLALYVVLLFILHTDLWMWLYSPFQNTPLDLIRLNLPAKIVVGCFCGLLLIMLGVVITNMTCKWHSVKEAAFWEHQQGRTHHTWRIRRVIHWWLDWVRATSPLWACEYCSYSDVLARSY